jgi:hypothetical protein
MTNFRKRVGVSFLPKQKRQRELLMMLATM